MSQTHPSAPVPDLEAPRTSRTYDWADPGAVLPLLARTTGADYVGGIVSGEVPAPPIAATLGFGPMRLADGEVGLELLPQPFHDNPLGSMHGGVICALLDTVAGCAVHATLPAGTGYTSLDLTVRFVRPVTVDVGVVRATGRVLHRGSRTAVAEARLTDGADRLLATATSTCLLLLPR